jgi:hypothetical protein
LTRSSFRARTTERGFVLLAAIVLAVLYFALMELLLIDSARELNEARRFRARIVAAVLAENAAELAVLGVVDGIPRPVNFEDDLGRMEAKFRYTVAPKFVIDASGETKGTIAQTATVQVHGERNGGQIRIDFTFHSQ